MNRLILSSLMAMLFVTFNNEVFADRFKWKVPGPVAGALATSAVTGAGALIASGIQGFHVSGFGEDSDKSGYGHGQQKLVAFFYGSGQNGAAIGSNTFCNRPVPIFGSRLASWIKICNLFAAGVALCGGLYLLKYPPTYFIVRGINPHYCPDPIVDEGRKQLLQSAYVALGVSSSIVAGVAHLAEKYFRA